jgi:hypothetical protein
MRVHAVADDDPARSQLSGGKPEEVGQTVTQSPQRAILAVERSQRAVFASSQALAATGPSIDVAEAKHRLVVSEESGVTLGKRPMSVAGASDRGQLAIDPAAQRIELVSLRAG